MAEGGEGVTRFCDSVIDQPDATLRCAKMLLAMPMYEYLCNGCGQRQSRLVYSWTPADGLNCNHCASGDLSRLMSGFSFHRSWGDSLNWMPDNAAGDLDDSHIGSIDSHMGRMNDAMGGVVTPDFHEHRHEINHPDP